MAVPPKDYPDRDSYSVVYKPVWSTPGGRLKMPETKVYTKNEIEKTLQERINFLEKTVLLQDTIKYLGLLTFNKDKIEVIEDQLDKMKRTAAKIDEARYLMMSWSD